MLKHDDKLAKILIAIIILIVAVLALFLFKPVAHAPSNDLGASKKTIQPVQKTQQATIEIKANPS